jgi:hypothetical protein
MKVWLTNDEVIRVFISCMCFPLDRIGSIFLPITHQWYCFQQYFIGCKFYSSPSIIRIIKSTRMRWAGRVARMGEKRNVLVIGRKPEGKRPLGRTET